MSEPAGVAAEAPHLCSGPLCSVRHHAWYGYLCNVPRCDEDFCIGAQEECRHVGVRWSVRWWPLGRCVVCNVQMVAVTCYRTGSMVEAARGHRVNGRYRWGVWRGGLFATGGVGGSE